MSDQPTTSELVTPTPAQRFVYLRDPSTGAPTPVAPENVQLLLQNGYQPMTGPEIMAYSPGYEHSLGEMGKAVGEGILGTVLPVIGPAAESALLGNAPEQLRRQQEYPLPHMLGAGLGIAGAGLAGGVLKGGLAGAVKLTGPALAEQVGKAAIRGVAEFSPEVGVAARLLAGPSTALGRLGAAAADFTAQGATYGAYDAANRIVLGDPHMGAEEVMREVGVGALTGGALGSAGSLAVSGLRGLYGPVVRGIGGIGERASAMDPEATKFIYKYRSQIESMGKKIPGLEEIVHERPGSIPFILDNQAGLGELAAVRGAVYDVLDAPPATAQFMLSHAAEIVAKEKLEPGLSRTLSLMDPYRAGEVLKVWPKFLSDPDVMAEVAATRANLLTNLYNNDQYVTKVFDEVIRTKKIQDMLAVRQFGPPVPGKGRPFIKVPFTQQGVAQTVNDFTARIEEALNRIRGDAGEGPGPLNQFKYYQPAGKQLEVMYDAVKQAIPKGTNAQEAYPILQDFVRTFSETINWKEAPPGPKGNTQNLFKALRNDLNDMLHDQARWGPLGLVESEISQAYRAHIQARKAFEKRFMETPRWEGIHPAAEAPIEAQKVSVADVDKVRKSVSDIAKGQGIKANAELDAYIQTGIKLAEVMRDAGSPEAEGLLKILRDAAAQFDGQRHLGNVTAWANSVRKSGSQPVQLPGPDRASILDYAGYFARYFPWPLNKVVRAIEQVRDPWMMAGFLNAMDHVNNAANAVLDSHVSKIFGQAVSGAAAQKMGAPVAPKFTPITRENFAGRMAAYNSYAGNPDGLAQWIEQNLGPTISLGGTLGAQIQVKTTNQHQHMSSKLPKPIKLGLLDRAYKPSPSELVVLNRHAAVMNDPYEVTRVLRAGRLTPDHIEAGDVMWPATMNKIRVAVAERMFELGQDKVKALPARVKDGIAQLLGTDLEWRQSAHAIAGTQRLYQSQATPQQAAQSKIDPRVELKSARMYATSTQATTGHLEKGIG